MPEVDGLRLGLTVDLLMAMGEAAALSLQRFHQTACQSSNADVSRGREAVFRGRFLSPLRCWIIFLVTPKNIPHAKQVLMCQRIQQQKKVGLGHRMCGNHLMHLL